MKQLIYQWLSVKKFGIRKIIHKNSILFNLLSLLILIIIFQSVKAINDFDNSSQDLFKFNPEIPNNIDFS